jgi:hypothetical protein
LSPSVSHNPRLPPSASRSGPLRRQPARLRRVSRFHLSAPSRAPSGEPLCSPADYGLPFRPLRLSLSAATQNPSRSPWARSTRATARIRFTSPRSVAFCESVHARGGCPTPRGRSSLGCFASLKPSPPAPWTSTLRRTYAPRAQRSPRSASGLRGGSHPSRVASRRPGLSTCGPLGSSRRSPRDSQTPRPARRVNPKPRLGKGSEDRSTARDPNSQAATVSRTHPKVCPSGQSWTASRRSPFFHDLCPVRPASEQPPEGDSPSESRAVPKDSSAARCPEGRSLVRSATPSLRSTDADSRPKPRPETGPHRSSCDPRRPPLERRKPSRSTPGGVGPRSVEVRRKLRAANVACALSRAAARRPRLARRPQMTLLARPPKKAPS